LFLQVLLQLLNALILFRQFLFELDHLIIAEGNPIVVATLPLRLDVWGDGVDGGYE